ncbi:MAG: sigma-54 interaction domain-containing protein [Oscillospiraceae bacterium]|jgi:transcriptional regulator with PAS, ATPase and Fis domain
MDDIQRVIDAIDDGIYIINREGYIVAANKSWVEHVNIPVERIIGRYVTDVLREYYFSAQCLQESSDWKMRENEYEQAVSLRVLSEGGRIVDFFEEGRLISIGTPIYDDNGDLSYVLTLVRDQTAIPDYDRARIYQENLSLPGSDLLGVSPEVEHIRSLIDEVADTDATILITGETGVGKEVVADEIQRRSCRRDKPFIKLNCAAIPENLVEAELFGYESGAFTGASKGGKPGLFEAANHGTILLDEIGEFPLQLQPKLLRAIQERVITRVGGVASIPINVRVLASTNQDLKKLVEQRRFREDLYYRLNVIPIYIPPLRERRSDIPLLAKTSLQEFCIKYNRSKVFTKGALQVMEDYDWPGNVRELRNLVERLTVLGLQREITAPRVHRFLNWKGSQYPAPEQEVTLKEAVDRLEYNMIEAALLRYGSTYRAAEALGTSQSTLVRKAQRLGISLGPRRV